MKVQGLILDWAGTTVDYGCMAPVHVFFDIFRMIGIEPAMESQSSNGVLKMGSYQDDAGNAADSQPI